jgi:hypothetical protein
LRPHWITASEFKSIFIQKHSGENQQKEHLQQLHDEKYYNIVCINASDSSSSCGSTEMGKSFVYTPGAGDDEESWSRGLTPRLFWNHVHCILYKNTDALSTEQVIDDIVRKHCDYNNPHCVTDDGSHSHEQSGYSSLFDTLGDTMISIGSRRAGRPPECWDQFDAILNVSDMEYENMMNIMHQNQKFYLQLPVKEGKRDKSELERWMAIGVCFVGIHAQQGRRVLIHCAQGLDRSVAVAIAAVTLFCRLQFPIKFQDSFWDLPFSELQAKMQLRDEQNEIVADQPYNIYKWSGLCEGLVENFMGRQGRDKLMHWLHDHHPHGRNIHRGNQHKSSVENGFVQMNPYKFDKKTIRIALLLIQQDREKASPTRSTMQKLHRFFLSP